MKKITFLMAGMLVTSAFIFFSSGCVNNKKDVLYACDSLNVSYSKTIKPIFENSCNSCHGASTALSNGGGIILDNYNDLINFIDTSPGSDGGLVLRDVQHTGNPMPKGQNKLSDCEIGKIAHWISEGGLDN